MGWGYVKVDELDMECLSSGGSKARSSTPPHIPISLAHHLKTIPRTLKSVYRSR